METFFLLIYNFFSKRRIFFFAIIVAVALVIGYLATRISFEEDINKMVSGGTTDKVSEVLKQSKFLDKLIITVSQSDTTGRPLTEELIARAERLTDSLHNSSFSPYISAITFRMSPDIMGDVMNIMYSNLPVFLDGEDYASIDSLTSPEQIAKSVKNDYNTLLSPASFAMKKMIIRDPLGLNGVALKKLGAYQNDDNYLVIDGCIFSKDKRHLLLFLTTAYPSNETSKNMIFLKQLDGLITSISEKDTNISIEYFGSAAVAAGNAERLKKDIRFTLTLTIILLGLIINFSIKKKSLFPFIFLPALFGGATAIAVIYLVQAKISIISLSIGTVILAITVDYSLHITTHYKHRHDILQTIKDVAFPIIVCGFATAFEFITLVFVSSESLHELGILAAISVITASFFTMVVIPHILDLTKKETDETEEKNYLELILDRITRINFHKKKLLLIFMVIFTVAAVFYIPKVSFEDDMMKMNYMSEKLIRAEDNLNRINNLKLNTIYLVSTGDSLEKALQNNELLLEKLIHFKKEEQIKSFNNPGILLISDSLQKEKIRRWNNYWTKTKKEEVLKNFKKSASATGFKPELFKEFNDQLTKNYNILERSNFKILETGFYPDNITVKEGLSTVVSVLKVDDNSKDFVSQTLGSIDGVVMIDRKSILSKIVDVLGKDFNFIANVSLSLILLILIIAFGRFELGFITFIPILLSWVWTLGIMGMAGIKFNIFNIIISSFITGLGIDYSIYIMQGLVQGFKTDSRNLLSYKTCILISVLISISGTGVLILAKHPSLNSIALISIIGLLAVVLISYTFEPVLFYWLISKKGKKRVVPLIVSDIIFTIIPLTFSFLVSIFMHVVFVLLLILPIKKKTKKHILHYCMVLALRVSLKAIVNVKIKKINEGMEDFSRPAIIIANHQSHLDLPVLLALSPKIIALTTTWVWNNPLYALLIRYLDYYPVTEGYEKMTDKLRKKVEEGYSILIFPEGTRSEDFSIKRFHKGAFFLAKQLDIDIVPVLVHGAGDCMNKGENHVKGGKITVKIYSRMKAGDPQYGSDYHGLTKTALHYFRSEYRKLKEELETPSYFRRKLIRNYIFKGPVLEWYTRIKTALEGNYELINGIIPRDAVITDVGCGYGMMSYMLSFVSDKRKILGIDYDADKIDLALHCISKTDNIHFIAADATEYPFSKSDVFILSDVLHYLPYEKQEKLLVKCIKNLNQNGVIILRDANRELKKRHWGSRYTEFFSTRSGFNKAEGNKLFFFSGKAIEEIIGRFDLKTEVIDNTTFTSNIIYIIRK